MKVSFVPLRPVGGCGGGGGEIVGKGGNASTRENAMWANKLTFFSSPDRYCRM